MQPTWSPDGTRIAFVGVRPEAHFKGDFAFHGNGAERGHGHDIFVIDSDGGHLQKLTNAGEGKIGDQTPSWSPDGSMIAFMRGCIPTACDNPHIALMNADGSNIREITSGPGYDFRPTWSPDGSTIAFERDSHDFTRADIYTLNADGSGLTKVLEDQAPFPDGVSWSPDGSMLSFWDSSVPGVSVLDLSTTTVTPLASAADLGGGSTVDRWTSWSPDGRWIAVGACCEGTDGEDLYLVSTSGGVAFAVPNGEAATSPSWQPISSS
jgi:Tol biopolymer transport system component